MLGKLLTFFMFFDLFAFFFFFLPSLFCCFCLMNSELVALLFLFSIILSSSILKKVAKVCFGFSPGNRYEGLLDKVLEDFACFISGSFNVCVDENVKLDLLVIDWTRFCGVRGKVVWAFVLQIGKGFSCLDVINGRALLDWILLRS